MNIDYHMLKIAAPGRSKRAAPIRNGINGLRLEKIHSTVSDKKLIDGGPFYTKSSRRYPINLNLTKQQPKSATLS